jgi:hypothetical protein
MKSRTKITRHIKMLFQAQDGLCFLCDQAMLLERGEQDPHGLVVSKEHVYPIGHPMRRTHDGHGVVLSHADCNSERGPRWPTEAEVEKAKQIHARLGEIPPEGTTQRRLRKRVETVKSALDGKGRLPTPLAVQQAEWNQLPFNPALPGLAERRTKDA